MPENEKMKKYPDMTEYTFEIVISALNCPLHKEQLQPNGDFGRYWCKHPEWEDGYHPCCKEICPLLKDSIYRIYYPEKKVIPVTYKANTHDYYYKKGKEIIEKNKLKTKNKKEI